MERHRQIREEQAVNQAAARQTAKQTAAKMKAAAEWSDTERRWRVLADQATATQAEVVARKAAAAKDTVNRLRRRVLDGIK